jgi:tryptophan synthase
VANFKTFTSSAKNNNKGYYNPLLQHGEDLAVKHAREAGANGFIVVDLPPEEAIKFREICTSEGYVSQSRRPYRLFFLCGLKESLVIL